MITIPQLVEMREQFDYFTADIGDITPQWNDLKRSDGIIERKMDAITYKDKTYTVGERFILSFCSKFGIGTSIFYLFNPSEVFERIQMVHPRGRMRVVTHNQSCLAATSPNKSFVDFDTLMDIINSPKHSNKIVNSHYREGIVRTVHTMNEAPWEINGELFHQTFTMETPIDGYGLPSIYLSLVRESNNTMLTADSKTFRSEIQLGKNGDHVEIPVKRALDTFNNEEGFQALRQRLESAQTSLASLHECDSLLKVMTRNLTTKESNHIFESYFTMIGDVSKKYGIATEDSISAKKARLLPMNCRVIDLIFFDMEITTRFFHLIRNIKTMTSWIGQTIDNEYDLEGSIEQPEIVAESVAMG